MCMLYETRSTAKASIVVAAFLVWNFKLWTWRCIYCKGLFNAHSIHLVQTIIRSHTAIYISILLSPGKNVHLPAFSYLDQSNTPTLAFICIYFLPQLSHWISSCSVAVYVRISFALSNFAHFCSCLSSNLHFCSANTLRRVYVTNCVDPIAQCSMCNKFCWFFPEKFNSNCNVKNSKLH